ncbi:MAG: N-carbamoyl-D-amino-acid hydrolase [Proteobacteria bacterium]|nr:N-carbamoyl-D-amino-acid hydrolase [Pseudomonadota bacterium]
MARIVRIAGAQLGPIQKADTRAATLERLIALLRQSHARGAELVVFPELALTTFFPRWTIDDERELDSYFEREIPGPDTQALFDEARRLKLGFYLGYAELAREAGTLRRYNSAVLVGREGRILGKYRKVHLPGHTAPQPGMRYQQLEKRYFEYGNLGFPVWRAFGGIVGMAICNDRRWVETFRVMGMKGVELVLIGYNSAAYDPNRAEDREGAELRTFHSRLAAQAGAYQNATWVVAIAKAGVEDGAGLIGGSCIVDPQGRIVAEAKTLADEVIYADCDLDACAHGKEKMFNFAAHRRPEHYRIICERAGAWVPEGKESW